MDKKLKEVRNELDNPKETLILKGCEKVRRFLSAIGYSFEKDKATFSFGSRFKSNKDGFLLGGPVDTGFYWHVCEKKIK